MEELEELLDKKFRGACRVVLGEEIGPISDYFEWLGSHIEQPKSRKSSISGKMVTYAINDYAEGSRWASLDEIDFNNSFEPLSINEIKDIDSLASAVGERVMYAGNIVLGNSACIKDCCNVNDSHYLYKCSRLGDSKYLAECHWGRLNESCFGCHGPGESQFMIGCGESFRSKRCFEAWSCHNSADIYYSHNLEACQECSFCFNLKNAKRSVGNLPLAKDEYARVKKKLQEDIASELKRKKAVPLLLDIVAKSKMRSELFNGRKRAKPSDFGLSSRIVSSEFSRTSKLLLGTELSNIDAYSEWLQRHTEKIEVGASAWSGTDIYMAPMVTFGAHSPLMQRILDIEEAWEHGESVRLAKQDALELRLQNAHELIGDIAFFVVDFREGTNIGCEKCDITIDSADAYFSCSIVYSKRIGYTFWTRSCENVFGCDSIFDSSFCINCYKSQKLSRCFEAVACRDCADSYFIHNCENVRDSIFCFNVKNLKNAIGNAPLSQEKFNSVKGMLLGQMADELQKKKDLKWDIYNIGAKKR